MGRYAYIFQLRSGLARAKRRNLLALTLVLLMALQGIMVPGSALAGEGNRDSGPTPVGEMPFWYDPYDDLSKVYVLPSGLVGVEVADGEVRLRTGYDEGWIASEVITSPEGFHFDFVLAEAELPGDSYLEISMLNASKLSEVVGFANATIDGYVKQTTLDLSVDDLDVEDNPRIRIQVNLVADGTYRPRLLSLALYFIANDQWRDDFVSPGKMLSHNGLNLTDGMVEINRSKGAGLGQHEPYPTVMFQRSNQYIDTYYPTTERTSYQDVTNVRSDYMNGFCFDDLNGDGDLDLVVCKYNYDSEIWWGTGNDIWSDSGATKLRTLSAYRVDTGDFNGDGEVDIVFAGSDYGSFVYLNQGGGSFNTDPDITLINAVYVATGKLNDDNYDDILTGYSSSVYLYYGGKDGPDTTIDHQINTGSNIREINIDDINYDGLGDIFLSISSYYQPVFMGNPSGPNTTADFTLMISYSYSYGSAAGDINGDGYIDLCFLARYYVNIFLGSASGINTSYHSFYLSDTSRALGVADANKDGYDDIYVGTSNQFKLFMGGETLPTSANLTKSGINGPYILAIAVPKVSRGGLQGTFETEAIELPEGKKWDILNLEGSVVENTTMSLSIMDRNREPIDEYTELTDWNVDLSGLDGHNTIYIRVSIRSEFSDRTPVLEWLVVEWMDGMAWRERFYGRAKVDSLMNLAIQEGVLTRPQGRVGPPLVFANLRNDLGWSPGSIGYVDAGGLDYLDLPAKSFDTKGTGGIATADVDGDGFGDIIFATYFRGGSSYSDTSPLFLGTPVGWKDTPAHRFPTIGARDVTIADLDLDGHMDVVFAQEQDGSTMRINSTVFWGSASGWSSSPDEELETWGASGVEAVDLNGDNLLDLVFACYSEDLSTTTDSMVFLQTASGFNGKVPSYRLRTHGARAVAAGDLDGDTLTDLVFANSFQTGAVEIDSFVYWGKSGGGFVPTPTGLATMGAMDVKVADLDGDDHLDIVFANSMDNTAEHEVDSYVYLNDGSGGFPENADFMLPTSGASAVAVVDIDGTGYQDLVFACMNNVTSYEVGSYIFLGNASGWPRKPHAELPTMGAMDVSIVHLMDPGQGGYLSETITPENPSETGTFHTMRCTVAMGSSQTAMVRIVDADTGEILTETSLVSGANEWSLVDTFMVRDHPSIRVMVDVENLEDPGDFAIDEIWLNWSHRMYLPPVLLGLEASQTEICRGKKVAILINATDEYDLPKALSISIWHRLNGTTAWSTKLVYVPSFSNGVWSTAFSPMATTTLGEYDIRLSITDSDGKSSGFLEFPQFLTVLNDLPTAPTVRIVPEDPVTASTLTVEIVRSSTDFESTGLTYRFQWYLEGVLVEGLDTEEVSLSNTSRGQNWSVEVRAWDGDEEGPPGMAWTKILNMAPIVKGQLPSVEMSEDETLEDAIDLRSVFSDADGDPLTFALVDVPQHLTVTINNDTGFVSITPQADWNGDEELTFVANDGDLQSEGSVMVKVTVLPVNDLPRFVSVNGKSIEGDTVEFSILQGELLTIDVLAIDMEGDTLFYRTNSTLVDLNTSMCQIQFQPDNYAVGTLFFNLEVWDAVSNSDKVRLNFVITVENTNDPMGVPRILSPLVGETYKVNQSISLYGVCSDPDTEYGQVLNFSWHSNMTGHLGYEPSLTIRLLVPGVHNLTLYVTDGEFHGETFVQIIIEPRDEGPPVEPPNGDDGGEPLNIGLIAIIVIVLVILGAVAFVAVTKRRTEKLEAEDEEDYKREHLQRAATAIKEAADQLEQQRDGVDEWEEDALVVETEAFLPAMGLSMEAQKTEAASADVQKLWAGISDVNGHTEVEKENLQMENLKRKYQNAIGRLPYGIPSKELADQEWVDLAAALATGQKKTVEGGVEVTNIDGRWYYSDAKDTGTFLKEHGAKHKAEARSDVKVATDKKALLDKLEERFILGEVSEETYKKLIDKYEKE